MAAFAWWQRSRAAQILVVTAAVFLSFAAVLLFVLAHALLTNLMGDLAAWWTSLLVLIGVTTGGVSLWIRRRRRQKVAQEQAWQRAMRR